MVYVQTPNVLNHKLFPLNRINKLTIVQSVRFVNIQVYCVQIQSRFVSEFKWWYWITQSKNKRTISDAKWRLWHLPQLNMLSEKNFCVGNQAMFWWYFTGTCLMFLSFFVKLKLFICWWFSLTAVLVFMWPLRLYLFETLIGFPNRNIVSQILNRAKVFLWIYFYQWNFFFLANRSRYQDSIILGWVIYYHLPFGGTLWKAKYSG